MSIKTVLQPPYIPDVAPCDFWLFPKLRGCRYERIDELKEAVTKVIDTLNQEEFLRAFQKLLERYTGALQPEEITSKGIRISCVYYQQKCLYVKSLETYLMILVPLKKFWSVGLFFK